MVFCNITAALVDELIKLVKGRAIADCGAGECMLEQECRGKISVTSLDIIPRDPSTASVDCTKMTFHKGLIPVFIRPSHGGWVEATVKKNLFNVGFFLYIGLEKNLGEDLGQFQDEVYIVSDWVGDEGERIYRVDGAYGEGDGIKEHLLISTKYASDRWWVRVSEDGERYENIAGGYCSPSTDVIIHDRVQAASFQELDWSKTYLMESERGAGWLDRDGRFFGCPMEQHDQYVRLVMQKEVGEVEDLGWVRIEHHKEYLHTKRLSVDQMNWLSAKGYEVDDGRL